MIKRLVYAIISGISLFELVVCEQRLTGRTDLASPSKYLTPRYEEPPSRLQGLFYCEWTLSWSCRLSRFRHAQDSGMTSTGTDFLLTAAVKMSTWCFSVLTGVFAAPGSPFAAMAISDLFFYALECSLEAFCCGPADLVTPPALQPPQ